jgi:hypothetical protein
MTTCADAYPSPRRGIVAPMSMPAGSTPPAPETIEEVPGRVHAIDGDGSPLCTTGGEIEQIDRKSWLDVPAGRRCQICDVIAG